MTRFVQRLKKTRHAILSRHRRVRCGRVATWCVALVAAWAPGAAWAAPIVDYSLQPFGVYGLVNSDSLGVLTASFTNADGSGTGAVKADHGSLGAFAEARGRFGVLSTVVFLDTLTVTSSTLADGTPVDLAIALSLDYELSGSNGGGSIDAFLGLGNIQSGQATTQFTAYSDLGITVNRRTAVLHTFVGAVLGLTAQLHVGAGAGNCCEDGYGFGDALNTMHFFVDAVGLNADQFTYVSETGAPYFTPSPDPVPVPEPATLLLLASGLGGLLARQRHRRP
jgi:hypothetical protein